MKQFFKFEAKIGWSEIIALLALIISIASIVYQNVKPSIVIDKIIPTAGQYYNKKESKWVNLSYHRIVIRNVSDRDLTLTGILPLDEPSTFFLVSKDNKVNSWNDSPKVYLINESLPQIKENPDLLLDKKYLDQDELKFINKDIDAGKSIVLNLAVIFDGYNGKTAKGSAILWAMKLKFSDGSDMNIAKEYL